MRKESRSRRKKGGREGIEKVTINEEIKKIKKARSRLRTREKRREKVRK